MNYNMKDEFEENPIRDFETENRILLKKLIYKIITICLICVGFYYIAVEIDDEFEKPPKYSLKSYINYVNGEKMPTLYLCTGYKSAIDSEYRLEDTRFGDRVTTIEITYEQIPKDMINKYESFLLTQDYEYLDYFGNEAELFVKNVKNEDNEKYSEYAAFIIIVGDTRVIYGVLEGTYDRIFY